MGGPATTEPRTTEDGPRATRRLAHLSDVHFGRIADPRIIEALVADVNGGTFDLVVVSGDLTQRARPGQYREARAFLDRLDPPVLVVPGNHDVRAWWHAPFHRVFRHADRFRRFISPDETPSFAAPGLAVFGLDSSHGLTVKGGKIRERHLVAMDAFFADQPPEAFRVLTLHHHLVLLKEVGRTDLARGAAHALRSAQRAGVELVLCGHYHISHVEHAMAVPPSADLPEGHRLVIASAGTATSNRGRGAHRHVNFYNWVHVGASEFTVEERRYDPEGGRFASERSQTFARVGSGVAAA